MPTTSNGSTNTNTSGESNVAFDYNLKKASDCISDDNMAEITRRLQGFVTSDETGDVVFSQDPPNDVNKIWIEISNTGAIIGTVKRYDTATGQWVDDHFVPGIEDEPLKLFIKVDTIASDDQIIQYNHSFGTGNYIYTVTMRSAQTVEARWFQESNDNENLEIHYLDMIGVEVELRVLEYDNEA